VTTWQLLESELAAIAVRTLREVFGCPRPEGVVVRIGHWGRRRSL